MTSSIDGLNTVEILRKGLPASSKQDVIIVGAGIAGLTAANLLKDAGHYVRIFESQQRNGGRLYTHFYPDGRYAELGGMRYAPGHIHAHTLFKQYGMTVLPFPLSYKEVNLNGRTSEINSVTLRDMGFDVEQSFSELMEKTMAPAFKVFDDIKDEDEAYYAFINQYDGYSIRDYLVEQNLTDSEIAAIALLNNIEGRMAFNFAEWAMYVREDAFGSKLTYLKESAGTLCDRMAEPLSSLIQYGARVTEVKQTISKAEVSVLIGGKEHTYKADAVVMTPPPIVLRHIKIEGMDGPKREAVRSAYAGRAAKVFLQFSKRWWEDRIGTNGGMCITDLPSRNIVFTVAGQGSGERGQIIGSYTWEADAMVMASLSPEERILRVLDDVVSIYPEAHQYFEGGVAHDWGNDQHAGGVGGLFQPHQMTSKHYQRLLQPVGRVWFAGETYDRKHRRWIESAIRSAVKNVYALTMSYEEIPWLD
ncbi:FAD-dependent oxidoreductase [Vibrio sp. CAU 1672]|uniref:flavin monoamine oxidase family protein n=1 Tax=Vibrio sp. CAU 1672 TaxID=3032594 RepID=UPI0023DC94D8|nr:FAD-dependent oxidoreductase [Vibrio sp. CAU 1672]MDF2156056.1 FAD-dependent oxidoreductase [Vibrio sp. CAU 1672]